MLDRKIMEEQLAELPLYAYFFIDPRELEFSQRIRWICENECPMYGTNWACPPGVGTVEECEKRCGQYGSCLVMSTITEVNDISNLEETLDSRHFHEEITNEVRELFRQQGTEPYVLSCEACAQCKRCTILDGEPCRFPEKMHPCVESHGINLLRVIEEHGLMFQYGENVVTWFSLLFFE